MLNLDGPFRKNSVMHCTLPFTMTTQMQPTVTRLGNGLDRFARFVAAGD